MVAFGMSPDGELGGMQGLTVSVARGTLEKVTLLDTTTGSPVPSAAAVDGVWHGRADLPPHHPMTLRVQPRSADGRELMSSRSFDSGAAAARLTADVQPYGEKVVGIAYPIVVRFNRAVPAAARAAVQQSLVVPTSSPVGHASWSWVSSHEVHYRPQQFWPAGTTVTVNVGLTVVHVSQEVWGQGNRDVSFTIGRSQVTKIDDTTHQMQVVRGGTVVRTVPVSLGKPGFITRSCIKVITSREATLRMDSTTAGITGAEAYDVTVQFARRMTDSGEFIHAAPWTPSSVSRTCPTAAPTSASPTPSGSTTTA